MKRLALALSLQIIFTIVCLAQKDASKYIQTETGLYIENLPDGDLSADRYTRDNKAYKVRRKFIFDYYVIKNNDTFKISAPSIGMPNSDFQRDWIFVSHRSNHADKLNSISIEVLSGISNEQQTLLQYEYHYSSGISARFSSTSGVIENEMNTWMHPHRDKYFMILELNPFPYIRQPFRIGAEWTWTLRIGDHWSDKRWREWSGTITNNYQYKLTGKTKLKTREGVMLCWIVDATASSMLGTTKLRCWYNEENGFVRLEYLNIDGSRLHVELIEAN